MTTVARSQTYGGEGGSSFDDSHRFGEWGRIQRIVVRSGTKIDAITVFYANGNRLGHGGTGGSEHTIDLAADEIITKVEGRSGKVIDQLKFTTNKGKTHGPYGGSGGSPFTVNFGANKALHYVFGRSGNLVDQLGFASGDPAPALPTEIRPSPGYGGGGGSPFDDLKDGVIGKIERIDVRHGARIDKISVFYQGAGDKPHGGNGGGLSSFALAADEWITEVHGRSGGRVDRLQFRTNKDRWSQVYGGGGGSAFISKFDGCVLRAIYGRSGGELDQIGFYFDTGKPYRMRILSLEYSLPEAEILELPPESVEGAFLTNLSDTPQTVSVATQLTRTSETTTTVANTHGASVSLAMEKTFTFVKATLTVGYTYQNTVTTGETYSESKSTTYTFATVVPGRSKIWAQATIKREVYDLPWTAQAEVFYEDDPTPQTRTIQGVLRGVSLGVIEANYGTPVPL